VTNSGSDLGFLAQTASAAREVLGVEQIDAVADKGYYKGEDIAACEDLGVMAYVARPQRGPAITEDISPRTSSATIPTGIATSAPATSVSIRILAPRRTGMSRSAMPICGPAGLRAQTAMRVRHAAEHRSVGE
jgi:hypothetical protein